MLVFPLINDLSRKIIHVDMDAFFAAIEKKATLNRLSK
jgi:DNA polymerase-4